MTYIEPLQDIMSYYSWNFSAYVFATAIVLLNTLKTAVFFWQKRKSATSAKHMGGFDLLTSALCVATLCGGMMFQGILADNNAPGLNNWNVAMWLLLLFSGGLFLMQLILYASNPKSK